MSQEPSMSEEQENVASNGHEAGQAKQTKRTRSSQQMWAIGKPENPRGTQLPTNRQVLKDFYAYRRAGRYREPAQTISGLVYDDIVGFWLRSGIPTVSKWIAIRRITRLQDRYQTMKAHRNRKTEGEVSNRQKFEKELNELFDIAAQNAEELISKDRLRTSKAKEEDLMFLKDQRTTRKRHLDAPDYDYMTKSQEKAQRDARYQQQQHVSSPASSCAVEDQNIGASSPKKRRRYPEDPDFEPQPGPSRSSSLPLTMPADVLGSPEVTSVADRLGVSSTAVSCLTMALLKSGGADIDKFKVSSASCRRKRQQNRKVVAKQAREQFNRVRSEYGAVHWDGKLMEKTGAAGKAERLAVLFSGLDVYKEGKLLGVPEVDDSTGETQARETMRLVNEWGLKSSIRALVFDTTASNTGRLRGAATRLESSLGRRVFWFACRHHMAEVIIGDVSRTLFGKTTGPVTTASQRFRESWLRLDKTKQRQWLEIDESLASLKQKAVGDIEDFLKRDSCPRNDYRELAELALAMLNSDDQYKMRAPGANHHARWMASLLYAFKRLAFSAQMEYDDATVQKLQAFCRFAALIYVPYWLQVGYCAADAPLQDLQLHASLHEYATLAPQDADISKAALTALNRHRWYLIEEVVPLALFSDRTSHDEKLAMAEKLRAADRPVSFEMGKPTFLELHRETSLNDLIGPLSWSMFEVLDGEEQWVWTEPDEWESSISYCKMKKFALNVKCVNDPAERSIKLMADCLDVAKDESEVQDLMQSIEHHRKLYPRLSKKSMT